MSWRALYPFASHFLGPQHYVDEGEGSPVLCVHGNPTWSFMWREVVLALRGSHRVVAPDHVGCGLSEKPPGWTYRLRDHIDNLERLVLHLDLRDVTLVVHDWGGAIGMGLAGRHPDRVARIAVLNTAAFPSRHIPLRIAACRVPGFGALAIRGLNGFAGAAVHMATERGLDPDVKAGYLAPYDSWANRIATLRFVQDIPMSDDHPSMATLKEVEAGLARLADRPMLIAWGERDWCFTPTFRAEWERRFPRARVVKFEDAGHYVVEDARERMVPLLAEFAGV
ncbi:MAG: alpha/beta fold hydrolase [Myxococcota bacterium]